MKSVEHVHDFLDAFVPWASAQEDIQALALVGSYARGAARIDSDIDLVLLTDQPQKYLEDFKWLERFGLVEKHQTEDYGKLISIRVWYQDGVEVEYGITTPDWAATPLDLLSKSCRNSESHKRRHAGFIRTGKFIEPARMNQVPKV
jgi:predicted nucleotidyltransferase